MTNGNHVYLLNRLLTDGIVIAHLIERYPHGGGVLAKRIGHSVQENVRESDCAFSKEDALKRARGKIALRRKMLMTQLLNLDRVEKELN